MARKATPPPPADEPDELEVAPAALAGKKAGEPEIVRWVARHIDHPQPDPETCPDPFAWTLLRDCRENPAFRMFFVEKLWAKLIPTRSQLDGGSAKEIDGKPTLELIGRIEALRAGAERPALPARPPRTFDDYVPEEDP